MEYGLTLTGPWVSLAPLTIGDAAELSAISRREDLRWHTSALPLDEETAAVNIQALLGDACKLLMLTQAFETWGCARVALRCDADNDRSAGAIRRLVGRPEGILRHHRRRHDGSLADTAYFSILAGEWPSVRADLRARVEA